MKVASPPRPNLDEKQITPNRTERASMTGAEAAEILRKADSLLEPTDRLEIAAGIEEARRRMNNGRLH